MGTKIHGANPPGAEPENRRSDRFPVEIPIEVEWSDAQGNRCLELAKATEASSHGAILQMKKYPAAGSQIRMTNPLSRETTKAQVAGTRRARTGTVRGIAVELAKPSDSFWGTNFWLRKSSTELVKLERSLRAGDIDPLILREFRDAVDYVRKTAWAVEEWRQRQMQHRDPQTVLSLLTAERVRRATQLSRDLLEEMKNKAVSYNAPGIVELHRTIEQLHHRLAEFLHRQSSE